MVFKCLRVNVICVCWGVNQRRTDNSMPKQTRTCIQVIVFKTVHSKQTTNQHESDKENRIWTQVLRKGRQFLFY